jgi:hypothetical protein
MPERNWKVTVITTLPQMMVALEPPPPGTRLPNKIGFRSRVTEHTHGDVEGLGWVTIGPGNDIQLAQVPLNTDLIKISFQTKGPTPEESLSQNAAALELLMDDLSFQTQTAMRVLMLELLDVTPPVEIGNERENLLYPYPIGWPYPKFQETLFHSDSRTRLVPIPRAAAGFRREKTRAALRWYVKAIATSVDVDRFALLWIALEILCSGSRLRIEKPYRASCGHEIRSCTECGRSTSRAVQGETLTAFLSEELSVQTADARELWKLRQLFHGSNHLTGDSIAALPRLLLVLKSAVVRGLKLAAGLPALDLPHVVAGVVGTRRDFALGGTRQVQACDLSDT